MGYPNTVGHEISLVGHQPALKKEKKRKYQCVESIVRESIKKRNFGFCVCTHVHVECICVLAAANVFGINEPPALEPEPCVFVFCKIPFGYPGPPCLLRSPQWLTPVTIDTHYPPGGIHTVDWRPTIQEQLYGSLEGFYSVIKCGSDMNWLLHTYALFFPSPILRPSHLYPAPKNRSYSWALLGEH